MRVLEFIGGPADGTIIVQGEDGTFVVITASAPVEWDGDHESYVWERR